MEKFVPYEKLSKKEKRKRDLAKRQTWGELNPVTRKPDNSKAYNRKRAQAWKNDFPDLRSYFLLHMSAEQFLQLHHILIQNHKLCRCTVIQKLQNAATGTFV